MPLPNILYLHSHDTGRFIQPYGHDIPTPNLRKLAEEGVLFRQAFCAAPTCSPSRAALLTGQSAHSSGMIGLAHWNFALADYSQHLIHTLQAAGYLAVLAGQQHVAADPARIGYDRILGNLWDDIDGQAASFLEEVAQDGSSRPFFLDAGFFETHRVGSGLFNDPGPQGDPRYSLPAPPLPDTFRTRQDMADFKVSAARLDQKMGRILRTLESTGLAENTLVICTTDHGIAFPRMKCNLTDAGIGVLLILRGPGGFGGGKVCDSLVSHVDLFPTVCEVAGVEAPPWLQGHSIVPLVSGEAAEIREEIFAEVTYHAAYEPQRAVRTRRWKYIRRWGDRGYPVLCNCDDSLSKEVWVEAGWANRIVPVEQLYDMLYDPHETNNLASEAAMAPILQEMQGRLDRWMKETNDPLLRGPVPIPAGCSVCHPDSLSVAEDRRVNGS